MKLRSWKFWVRVVRTPVSIAFWFFTYCMVSTDPANAKANLKWSGRLLKWATWGLVDWDGGASMFLG